MFADAAQTVSGAISAIGKAVDYIKNNIAGHAHDGSMTDVTRLTRAEPLTIISQDCGTLEILPELLNTLTNVYSGYFLQAAAMLGRATVSPEVIRILDKLNPNRDSSGYLLEARQSKTPAFESIHQVSSNYRFSLPTNEVIAAEALDTQIGGKSDATNTKVIYETAQLAVGKLINVDISVCTEDGKTLNITVPVNVRLSPALLNAETIGYIFTHKKEDNGIVERFHSWRAGRISLIKDMIFCQDQIDAYRRAAIKDKTGTLNEIARRTNNARTYGLLTNNPSLAVSSNIYVLTKSAAMDIEGKVGQQFKNPKGREKIFEDTYAMIVAVVDPEWEKVTFYYRDIALPSEISFRALKSSGKNKGPDVGDIMRSLLEGRAPTF